MIFFFLARFCSFKACRRFFFLILKRTGRLLSSHNIGHNRAPISICFKICICHGSAFGLNPNYIYPHSWTPHITSRPDEVRSRRFRLPQRLYKNNNQISTIYTSAAVWLGGVLQKLLLHTHCSRLAQLNLNWWNVSPQPGLPFETPPKILNQHWQSLWLQGTMIH